MNSVGEQGRGHGIAPLEDSLRCAGRLSGLAVSVTCRGVAGGLAHRAAEHACWGLDCDQPVDDFGAGQPVGREEGVVGTDPGTAVGADAYCRDPLAERGAVETVHRVAPFGAGDRGRTRGFLPAITLTTISLAVGLRPGSNDPYPTSSRCPSCPGLVAYGPVRPASPGATMGRVPVSAGLCGRVRSVRPPAPPPRAVGVEQVCPRVAVGDRRDGGLIAELGL